MSWRDVTGEIVLLGKGNQVDSEAIAPRKQPWRAIDAAIDANLFSPADERERVGASTALSRTASSAMGEKRMTRALTMLVVNDTLFIMLSSAQTNQRPPMRTASLWSGPTA